MVTIWKLKGEITEDGKLDITIPADVPVGEVSVQLILNQAESTPEMSATKRHNQETVELLKSMGVGGSWAKIDNPVEFVQKQREEDEKQRGVDW